MKNESDIIAHLRDLIDFNSNHVKTEAAHWSPASHFRITTAEGYKYHIDVVLEQEPE